MKTGKLLLTMLLTVAMFLSFASFTALADGTVALVTNSSGEAVETDSLTEAIQSA